MSQFAAVLNGDEIAFLDGIRDRIKGTRPTERGGQMLVHHAVEDAVQALICIGRGNPSCYNDFQEIGKSVRKAVLTS